MRLIRAVPLALLASLALGVRADAQESAARWYRGNTHTHTLNSDGDSPPDAVVRWYREHGYQFLFITDHEFITDVGPLNALFGASGRFLVLSAQEVTQRLEDRERGSPREAHVNALGIREVILPLGPNRIVSGMSIAETYDRNLSAIRRAGGVAQVNHPNFRWSVPMDQMLSLPDSTLLEVWNGHPLVYNSGGFDSTGVEMPSAEARWDTLLTRGRTIFGVADDDSHFFRPEDGDNADQPRPGRGWVMVRADTLTPEAILSGLRRGQFYASTGVTFRLYEVDQSGITLDVVPVSDRRYETEFVGAGGKVLARAYGTRARYRFTGSEGYVRARVTDSSGRMAWAQPVRPGR
jgi:hypothetical protein